jgi:2-hydroxy-6-oxonona-2,4-dienedioate hydrolase
VAAPLRDVLTGTLRSGGRTVRLTERWHMAAGLPLFSRAAVAMRSPGVPPVVLVHGLAISSRYMIPAALRLGGYREVHAVDLPGHGRSPRAGPPLDVPELAEALRGWMDAASVDRAVLVANSFGCQVAVDLAARRPERVTALVLGGPTADVRRRTALRQLVRWLVVNGPRESPSLPLVLLREWADSGTTVALAEFGHLLRDPVEEKLPRVEAPALVLRGTRDASVPRDWAQEVTRLLPRGRLVEIPSAHTVNYSAADRFAHETLRFLDRVLPRDPSSRGGLGGVTRGGGR